MKVVAVLFPDEHPDQHPDVLASTERGLDLGPYLAEQGHELVATSDTGDELDAHLTDAEVVITTPFWPLYLGRERIEKAANLRLVITAGVGSDQEAHDLEGKTVGIIGLGAIGARTALRLKPFDVTMLYHARRRRSPADESVLGVRYATLDDLISRSDVVCAALPLMEGSKALFDADRIATMKPGAWLVNTARGAIVDTDALREACESGRLDGSAPPEDYVVAAPGD